MTRPSVITTIGLTMLLLPGVICQECQGCGDNAKCDNGNCSCPAGLIGDPRIHCFANGTNFCSLKSDPILWTFSDEKVHVTIVGATRLADLIVTRVVNSLSQQCKLVVWALTERVRGKIFVDGLQIRFTRVEATGDSSVIELYVKSEIINETLNWDFKTTESISGKFDSCCRFQESLGDYGSCSLDYDFAPNDFFVFNFSCCGIVVGIRPPTPGGNSTPGIFVDVNHPNVTENWKSGFEPICLSETYDIDSVINETQLGDPWDAMSYLSLTNTGDLTYDGAPNNFTQLAQALRGCNDISTLAFYDNAVFALDTPPFINCISNSTVDQNGLVDFLLLVLDWFCVGDTDSCAHAKGLVIEKCQGVVKSYPSVQTFLDRPC